MVGPERLLQSEDRWQTRMGIAMLQERVVFRGKDLHRELADWSWLELHLYGVTGRTFSDTELKILNAFWVFTSYPDPRIWNNRVASLCGTVRSTGALGFASALAASDAEIFGVQPMMKATLFLQSALRLVQDGVPLSKLVTSELKKYRKVSGFGRPRVRCDERIEPMLTFLKGLDYKTGKHVELAFAVESFLIDSRRRMRINYAGLVAALGADMGFTARELYLSMLPAFTAGIVPCYVDALDHTEGTLFPLRCERIDYCGPKNRSWD